MEWFNGGVSEAIAAAKAKSAVFVVVVEGKISDLYHDQNSHSVD